MAGIGINHILVVDDDESTRQILKCILERAGYFVTVANDGAGALLELGKTRPDIVLTDWQMPEIDGTSLCRLIRDRMSEEGSAYVYIILMTARTEEVNVAEALDKGADGFLAKPFHGEELIARVRAAIRLTSLNDRLREKNQVDQLTGLMERDAFGTNCRQQYFQARRQGLPLAAMVFNLDYFAALNDTYGHAAGDLVLREVARIVTGFTSDDELVARYGGDEFCVLLTGQQADSPLLRAERLHGLIEGLTIEHGRREIHVRASFGVAECTDDVNGIENLLERAEAALRQAKRRGRNRVVAYEPVQPLQDALGLRR